MIRTRLILLAACLILVLTPQAQPATAESPVYLDPALAALLASASLDAEVQAIATFDRSLTSAETLALLAQNLGLGTISFKHLDTLALLGTPSQIKALLSLQGVTGLYANGQLEYYLDDSVAAIGAQRAWTDLGVGGAGVGIAVIDTGIDAQHPDLLLGHKTVQNVKIAAGTEDLKQFYEYRGRPPTKPLFVEGQVNTDTTSGHGTHVAGIAAGSGAASDGRYTGVAPEAHLVGIGVGEVVVVLWVLAAFDYVLDNAAEYNIRVVNNSWGETVSAENWNPKHPINEATRKLRDRGLTVVFAAGNDGSDPITGEPKADTLNHFAMAPWVISVAAGCTGDDILRRAYCPDGELASFSGRGVPGDARFHPTLTAPGVGVIAARATSGAAMLPNGLVLDPLFCTPDPLLYYTCSLGTSMAAPHVAGAIALVLEANPALSPDQVKQLLITTARPMVRADGTPYEQWEAGAGALDVYAAVLAAQASR